jgi:hypothetical protein
VVSASARRAAAAGSGDGVIVEFAQQLLVDAELLDQPVMNRAQPLHAIVKPGQILAGAGDLVARLVEQPGGPLVGGHGHEPRLTAGDALSRYAMCYRRRLSVPDVTIAA